VTAWSAPVQIENFQQHNFSVTTFFSIINCFIFYS